MSDKENNDRNMNVFGDTLAEQAAKNEGQRSQWEQEVGDPVVFIFIPADDMELAAKGFGTGFWKVPNGVLAVSRYANGYEPNHSTMYTNELIDTLVKVREGK